MKLKNDLKTLKEMLEKTDMNIEYYYNNIKDRYYLAGNIKNIKEVIAYEFDKDQNLINVY